MNIIFQKLFGPRSKNTHSASAWLNDLPEMDSLSALQFSTQKLAQTLAENTLSAQDRLKLIFQIEEINQSHLEKLSTQFISVENMKPALESSITETCYNYCRQSYVFHLKVIEEVIDPHLFKLEGTQPILILARAIHIALNMIKWRLYSQASTPPKVWSQIYTLYKIAQKQMLLNMSVELFNLSPVTTLSGHFVQICMFGELMQTGLQKQHIEIAAAVLNNLLTRTPISDEHKPDQSVFYIDLEKDCAAKRIRNIQPSKDYRYWDLDEFEKQISIAITTSDRGEIPQSLAFSKIDHAKKLNETLRILLEEWRKTGFIRQRRKESRSVASKTAKVNAGLVNICNQVYLANQISNGFKLTKEGKSFDERLRAITVLSSTTNLSVTSGSLDTWIITDESLQGIGARVNKYGNILARPDKLIGLALDEDSSKIIIGMIRSVKSTQGNQLRVGVEIFSRYPAWVQLRQMRTSEMFPSTQSEARRQGDANQSNADSNVDMGLFSGIYLPIEAGLSSTSALILPKISYRTNTNYAVTIAGESKQVLLGAPIESRDDWVKVAFPF